MSSVQRYHTVAIALHWVVALVLIGNLVLGILLDDIPSGPDKFAAFQLHKSLGITVLLLGLVRLFWRLAHKPPAYPASMAGWEKIVAHATHWIFYVLIIGVPFTGWMIVSASPMNMPTLLFGVIPWPHLPFFDGVADRKALQESIGDVHGFLAYSVLVLLVLHVGAALRHHFMLRDDTLMRMTPSRTEKFLRFIRGEKTV